MNAYVEMKIEKDENGKQTIIESADYHYIKTKLEFSGFDNPSYGTWVFDEVDGTTKVTWSMDTDMGWNLIGRAFGLFFESMVGSDFEAGLSNLKQVAEQIAEKATIEIEREKIATPVWMISMKQTVSSSGIDTIHQYIYSIIGKYMNDNKIEATGSPLSVYYSMTSDSIALEAGIPIKDSIKIKDKNIRLGKINPCNVISAMHFGKYDNLPATHALINSWIVENESAVVGAPWEVYITDPSQEKDEPAGARHLQKGGPRSDGEVFG